MTKRLPRRLLHLYSLLQPPPYVHVEKRSRTTPSPSSPSPPLHHCRCYHLSQQQPPPPQQQQPLQYHSPRLLLRLLKLPRLLLIADC